MQFFCFDFKFFKPKAFCIKISHLQLQCPTLLTVILYKQIFHNIHHSKSYGWNDVKKKKKTIINCQLSHQISQHVIRFLLIVSYLNTREQRMQHSFNSVFVFVFVFWFCFVCLFAPFLYVYALRCIIIQVMFPNFPYIQ